MAYTKRCTICGCKMTGFDLVAGYSICWHCNTESRKAIAEQVQKAERKKVFNAAKYYRDLPVKVTKFRVGIVWYKLTKTGFYAYYLENNKEVIIKKYYWNQE